MTSRPDCHHHGGLLHGHSEQQEQLTPHKLIKLGWDDACEVIEELLKTVFTLDVYCWQ
jgi:hypothetical protein